MFYLVIVPFLIYLLKRTVCTLKWAISDRLGLVVLKIAHSTVALERELRAHIKLLQVPHKSIVPLLDLYIDDHNRQVLVYPAYPSVLPTHKPLLLVDIARALRHLLEGLATIHQLGIIHMDITPANLLWDPSISQLAITDFDGAVFEDLPVNICGTNGMLV
jgi:serine/threonine protein kinase